MPLASCVALLVWIGSALHAPLVAQDPTEPRQWSFKSAEPTELVVVGIEPADQDRTRVRLRDGSSDRLTFIEAPTISIRASAQTVEISTEGATTLRSDNSTAILRRGPLRMILHREGPLEVVSPGNSGP